MVDARVTQVVSEILAEPDDQNVLVTQVVSEVLAQPTTQNGRVSQVVVEILSLEYLDAFGPPVQVI